MIALSVVLRSHTMSLGGVFMMLSCFDMRVFCHVDILWNRYFDSLNPLHVMNPHPLGRKGHREKRLGATVYPVGAQPPATSSGSEQEFDERGPFHGKLRTTPDAPHWTESPPMRARSLRFGPIVR